MRRATECCSMNSLMSMRTMAFSSSKRNSARALQSSVFPTPVGPRKRKLPMGRLGSPRPARLRRTASETARTASSWPMTRLERRSSIFRSFSRSPSSMRLTGTPVQRLTTSAISSEVTWSLTIAWPDFWRSRRRLLACFGLACSGRAFRRTGFGRRLPSCPARCACSSSVCLLSSCSWRDLIVRMAPTSFSQRAVSVVSFSLQAGEFFLGLGALLLGSGVFFVAQGFQLDLQLHHCGGGFRRARRAWSRSRCAAGWRLRRSGRSPCRGESGR